MDFESFAFNKAEQEGRDIPSGLSLLCFDPGHTTGWCLFVDYELAACGEIDTDDNAKATKNISDLIQDYDPTLVVYESYRIYSWRAKEHAGSEVLTIQVIGCIQTLCTLSNIEWVTQPAHVAKGFCTDKKLKHWGFWQVGQRHARDAIRHACYYLLFGDIKHGKRKGKGITVG